MVDTTLGAGSSVGISMDGGVPEDEIKGLTATRMIIDLTAVALTAGSGSLLAGGVYIIENDALSATVFAEPQDSIDDAGWMWRVARRPVFTSVVNDSSQVTRLVYDIRSQRKYPGEDYTLVMVLVNLSGGATSMNIDGIVRTLLKRA